MRLCRLLVLTIASALATSAALAADLPARFAPPPPPPPLPVFTWTGFYLGINAGYVFDSSTRFNGTVGFLPNNQAALDTGLRPVAHTVDDDGFTGGGQIGYNYQFGQGGVFGFGGGGLVVGIEADASYTDLDRTNTLSNTTGFAALVVPGAVATTRVNQYQGELDFLGTVRGRVGYAFNQFLIYGTGGFAYGDVTRRTTYFGPNAPGTPFFTGTSNGLKTGYTYGGGIEYAVPTGSFLSALNFFHASAITIKAEYLHYDLGRDSFTIFGVNGGAGIGGYTSRAHTEGDLARAGINYKF